MEHACLNSARNNFDIETTIDSDINVGFIEGTYGRDLTKK